MDEWNIESTIYKTMGRLISRSTRHYANNKVLGTAKTISETNPLMFERWLESEAEYMIGIMWQDLLSDIASNTLKPGKVDDDGR